jgi:hypothetical protein
MEERVSNQLFAILDMGFVDGLFCALNSARELKSWRDLCDSSARLRVLCRYVCTTVDNMLQHIYLYSKTVLLATVLPLHVL